LKIEWDSQSGIKTVRLIGRFQSEHIGELEKQLEDSWARCVLDLEEVTLVDVDVVRYLGSRERAGIEITHCPQYIREWITREGES
jgi:hypothetical protein